MPADASGVTTDDQGPLRNGGSDQSSARASTAPSESPSTAPARERVEDEGDNDSGRPADGAEPTSSSTSPVGVDTAPSGPPAATVPDWPDPTTPPIAPPPNGPAADTAELTTEPRPARGPAGLAGGEPPPAPVLIGPDGQAREGRGRHATPRRDRAAKRGLRVNQRLWSIDPWSVFKVSALFYLCVGLIVLVAGTLLYNAGRSVGTIDQVESFVTRMGAYGECTPQAEVAEGVEFEEDEDKCEEGEVLVGGFTLDDGTLFRAAAIGGTVLVVAGSIGNVLLTVLLNLLNELTGGLRHTIIKEPVARPQGGGSARPPGRARRLPVGSPRRRPPG